MIKGITGKIENFSTQLKTFVQPSQLSGPREVAAQARQRKSSDFFVHNYLKVPVTVKVGDNVIVENVPPKSKRGVSFEIIKKYIVDKNKIDVFIKDKLFSSYNLDLPEGKTTKALYVGMITSRWVGAGWEQRLPNPAGNAVQGRPKIKIHNTSSQPLRLNNNIYIEANDTIEYGGRDHFGVRIGTIFDDQDDVYQRFKFDVPATDVYYGVMSDLDQPIWGGQQRTPWLNEMADEPQYLLEMGWMAGPSPSFEAVATDSYIVPKQGPPTKDVDRWGFDIK